MTKTMTKTIDEQLERLASAQERSAEALEGILESLQGIQFPGPRIAGAAEEDDNAGTAVEETTTVEETAVEETEVEETQEEDAGEPEPEGYGDAEEPEEDEASSEDGDEGDGDDEGDPLGDGDASEQYALPEKLTNDTLRGFARDLMEKESKASVFEVLADVGAGYKAVGEVSKDDLKEAHEKMAERLKG